MTSGDGETPSDGLGDIAAAHQKVLADETLQFEATALTGPETLPSWLAWILDGIASVSSAVFEVLAPFLEVVFWGGIVLLLGGALFLLGREFLKYRSGKSIVADGTAHSAGSDAYRPAPETARALLAEADGLAKQGRFDEAVHVLLFRSIDDIQHHWPNHIHRAMTSREIAGLKVLNAASAQALSKIVAVVEQCRFAGVAVDENGFRRCRAAYTAFAEAGAQK